MTDRREEKLNFGQRIALELLWGVCTILSYSPRWFRFGILQRVIVVVLGAIGYRRDVIRTNLERSFPEKSAQERDTIMAGAYDTLAEIIVDTICLAGVTQKRNLSMITWSNREEHLARTKGRDWIALASHFGCWEYLPLWSWEDPDTHFMGVYHPLKSIVFEHFYRRLRNLSPNIHQVTMQDTIRHYIKNRSTEQGITLGLISDQTPNLRADTEWYDFLNQKTAFIDGGERLAMRFHIPVYFAHISRIERGRYSVYFSEIYDGVEDITPTTITRRYAKALEEMIRENPELWMWSHKRWKHTPEKQLRRFGDKVKKREQ